MSDAFRKGLEAQSASMHEFQSPPETGADQEYPADDAVLGYCPHGVNLDREFCPEGCRV